MEFHITTPKKVTNKIFPLKTKLTFGINSSDSEQRSYLFLAKSLLRYPPGKLVIPFYISIAIDWVFWW